ncbi:MAG: TadE family protein [Mycobacteriales bacterium]|nr:pilus assembly protein [Frankia sp.]
MRGPRARAATVGDRGAAAVEFALVAVLLFPMLFGMIAFGFALFREQAAAHAAREGARLAAVGVDDCASWAATTKSRGTGAQFATPGLEMYYSGAPRVGSEVVVEVHHTVDLSLISWLPLVSSSLSLTQTGRARVERVGSQTSCTA